MRIKLTLEVFAIAAGDAPPPPETSGLYMWSSGKPCLFFTREAAQGMINSMQALTPYQGMPGATVRELGKQEIEVEFAEEDMRPPVGCLHCSWEGERVYKLCQDCIARYIRENLGKRERMLGDKGEAE